jgi:hypothetical protein
MEGNRFIFSLNQSDSSIAMGVKRVSSPLYVRAVSQMRFPSLSHASTLSSSFSVSFVFHFTKCQTFAVLEFGELRHCRRNGQLPPVEEITTVLVVSE